MDTSDSSPIRSRSFEKWWPNLRRTGYRIIGPGDIRYNCFAWAVGRTNIWLDPSITGVNYWPPQVPREYTLAAFVNCLNTFGFSVCENEALESGSEKVVLYGFEDRPQPAARQTETGRWTSKIGESLLIEHHLEAFSVATRKEFDYGKPLRFLKKRIAVVS